MFAILTYRRFCDIIINVAKMMGVAILYLRKQRRDRYEKNINIIDSAIGVTDIM